MSRIGVFVCWCGSNIAGTVDVKRVVEELLGAPDVAHAEDHMYVCSDPGQEHIRRSIRDLWLDRVVVAACSPRMHEQTFRRAAAAAGLNPYLVEIANIREQCSWVHEGETELATRKALQIILAALAKVRRNAALDPIRVPLTRRALVVGAGIAGISAALELAEAGYETVVVERADEPGGKLRLLSRTFPHHEDARDILTPRIKTLMTHEKIRLYTSSHVVAVEGYVGNFEVEISHEPKDGAPRSFREKVGAAVLATGFDLYAIEKMPEYGGGTLPDVVDALSFEEMLRRSIDENDPVRRPSDGKVAEDVVFIQCAGSRDPERHKAYCSRICCDYTNKQARLYRECNPEGRATVLAMDVRTDRKGMEEYCQKNIEEAELLYVRGEAAALWRERGRIELRTEDTLTGQELQLGADLVVLASAAVPSAGSDGVAGLFRAAVDENGFFQESHIKLHPVESSTQGIYLAGACQFPGDITESVDQARAAASKVQGLFASRELAQDPLVAEVDADLCSACELCVSACPYDAREADPVFGYTRVREALCQGCAACVSVCPNKACQLKNHTPAQVMGEVGVFTEA